MRTHEVLDQIDDAIADYETGPDAMRCGAPAAAQPTRHPSRAPESTARLFHTIDVAPFVEAMNRFAEQMAALNTTNGALRRLQRFAACLARHHGTGPTPLAIDGHAYRRRTRSRVRRAR